LVLRLAVQSLAWQLYLSWLALNLSIRLLSSTMQLNSERQIAGVVGSLDFCSFSITLIALILI